MKILLSEKEVKGKIVLCPLLSQVADFHLKWSMLMENPKNAITGSYPRPDTSYCPRDGGLAGPKTDRPYLKDRRVQKIIGEIIYQTCPSLRKFL